MIALIKPALIAALIACATITVAASAARPASLHRARAASCREGTGARWHIKHYFYTYDSHGAVVAGENSRLPASGDRYVVDAGGTDCALAHKVLRRLTSALPDKALAGRRVGAFFVPPGYGYLFQSPHGFFCAATLDQTNSATENGDNLHVGYCAHLNHRGAFSWTAATPNPEKYKHR